MDEIDIVAINEIEKTVTFAEVKLNKGFLENSFGI
ncbi:hypothetical protein ACFSKL_13035 [Belliella marina]|uniref:Uncharacterized protein n=1 Tax=Belliella marina TaxID=1644146 RepID=A0ABW4VNJ8_9BACT